MKVLGLHLMWMHRKANSFTGVGTSTTSGKAEDSHGHTTAGIRHGDTRVRLFSPESENEGSSVEYIEPAVSHVAPAPAVRLLGPAVSCVVPAPAPAVSFVAPSLVDGSGSAVSYVAPALVVFNGPRSVLRWSCAFCWVCPRSVLRCSCASTRSVLRCSCAC